MTVHRNAVCRDGRIKYHWHPARRSQDFEPHTMLTLYHHPFCPFSRFVRLALSEYGLAPRFVEERPWERRTEFLVLNPAGTTPVLVEEAAARRYRMRASLRNFWTKPRAPTCTNIG